MDSPNDILNKLNKGEVRKLNDHILLVDSMNTFIRSFTTINYLNTQGNHIGGLAGFLRSAGFLTRTLAPTRVVFVFDGKGSTLHRKTVDANYKANRNLTKITNWEVHETKEMERDSMAMQMERLIEYLSCLPVQMLSIDKVEADDVIALIANQYAAAGKKATIVSSDKDFLQLVSPNIDVFSPIRKKNYDPFLVTEEFGVTPHNYLLFKALLGDKSDNLPGVSRLGAKTLLKHFPYLLKENTTLDRIFEDCEKLVEKGEHKKIHLNMLNQIERVYTNYELMNLQEPSIPSHEIPEIVKTLQADIPNLNIPAFEALYEADNMGGAVSTNIAKWLENFRLIANYQK